MSTPSCCAGKETAPGSKPRRDLFFLGCIVLCLGCGFLDVLGVLFGVNLPYLTLYGTAVTNLLLTMWWGVALGIVMVGLMNRVPDSCFYALLGRGDSISGIFRAALAGVLLDLCSHGILMVGAKLYERGASLAQVLTFLIASPWNSLSLTLILAALIGVPWTLAFIAGSVLIAVVTGILCIHLTRSGFLPEKPARQTSPESAKFRFQEDVFIPLKNFRPTPSFFSGVLKDGWAGGTMVLKWLLFGTLLAGAVRAFVPADLLGVYFGATLSGLALTILVTTIIEVCSEGSAPIGAELVNRAAAPGNGFAFLMAGVSTDYTEIMVLREMTGSWKAALILPALTLPQVVLLSWLMNLAG